MVMGRKKELLYDVSITREADIKEINKLKKIKSPEPDDIFPRVLKGSKYNIHTTGQHFYKSLDTRVVLALWRKANVRERDREREKWDRG